MQEAADDALPPPEQQCLERSEVAAIETELLEVTPHLMEQLSDLFEQLKELGLTTRLSISEFATRQSAMADHLCKRALAGNSEDYGSLDVVVNAAALVTRLQLVGRATSAAPHSSSAREPIAKRARKEPWLGDAAAKIASARALDALPQHLADEGSRIQLGHDEITPLKGADVQSWIDSCRVWCIMNGIVNHEDNPMVLKKVCRPTPPCTHLRPHPLTATPPSTGYDPDGRAVQGLPARGGGDLFVAHFFVCGSFAFVLCFS